MILHLLCRKVKSLEVEEITAGIYTGEGASHSWTWFVEALDPMEGVKKVYLDEADVTHESLAKLDIFLMGGGDVYGMAKALGRKGAHALEKFVDNGGIFLGSCAGAYLVMSGVNLPPYDPFNLIDAGMVNYAISPPILPGILPKYLVPYGKGYVFYPAYGPVELEMMGEPLLSNRKKMVAPLYGGPVIDPGKGAKPLGYYGGLQKGCITLASEPYMEENFNGGCAAAWAPKGKGKVFLFGPHLECPGFPEGNDAIRNVAGSAKGERMKLKPREGLMPTGEKEKNKGGESSCVGLKSPRNFKFNSERKKKQLQSIKRELSNARIVAFGLEKMPVSWNVGTKVWEPEKIRLFVEFCWRRIERLEKVVAAEKENSSEEEELEELVESVIRTREMIRDLKKSLDKGTETTHLAMHLFRHLKRQTVMLLETSG